MSLRAASYILGWVLSILAFAHIFPILVALRFQEIAALSGFIQSLTVTAFSSGILLLSMRTEHIRHDRHTALNALILTLIVAPVACGLPFYTTGSLSKILYAFFEGMSGLTTTGASLFGPHAHIPKSVLLWRILIEWFGGLVFIISATSLLPIIGVGGINQATILLPHGEGSGLLDRLRASFQMLGQTYASVTAGFALALWLVGMPFLDGLTLSMSALATGGFTYASHGIANYGNVAAEIVMAFALITGALNITLIRGAARGRFERLWQDQESHTFFKLIILAVIALMILFLVEGYGTGKKLELHLWDQIFLTISMLSTSGITIHDQVELPLSVGILLILLTVFGGSIISSSGGIKMLRVHILSRFSVKELARLAHPHGVFPVHIRQHRIRSTDILSIWALFLAFILCAAFGALLFAFYDLPFLGAIKMSIGFLTSTGSLAHVIDPSLMPYETLADGAILTGTVLMLAGRLEILLLLLPFIRFFQGPR